MRERSYTNIGIWFLKANVFKILFFLLHEFNFRVLVCLTNTFCPCLLKWNGFLNLRNSSLTTNVVDQAVSIFATSSSKLQRTVKLKLEKYLKIKNSELSYPINKNTIQLFFSLKSNYFVSVLKRSIFPCDKNSNFKINLWWCWHR